MMNTMISSKSMYYYLILIFYFVVLVSSNNNTGNIPSWDELDARTLPTWYDESKFGIFLHWGIFSVPSFGSEWFWAYWKDMNPKVFGAYVNKTERPGFTYQEYAHRFTAELYKPDYWADVFAKSGAQYVVLTSKHHEGFCNWNSKDVPTTWNWNVMDIGPKRDVLGDLAKEVKKQTSPQTSKKLKFGIYHSLYEWYNPMYQFDKSNNFTTQHFVDTKTIAELYDIVNKYEPEIIWSDGEWEAHSDYWKAREFLHWYSTNSTIAKTGIWNDRWGKDTLCKHGDFKTCTDRYNPNTLQNHKWENAFTIDKNSWGLNRNAFYTDYMTVEEIIHTLIQVVAFNGNVLLNAGPGPDGTLDPIFVDRLLGIGKWLDVNGEAIYGTKPWDVCQNETDSSIFYTTKHDRLYAIFTEWPTENLLELSCPTPTEDTQIHFMGINNNNNDKVNVNWTSSHLTDIIKIEDEKNTARHGSRELSSSYGTGINVVLPALTPNIIPCDHAWVIVISGLENH